MRHGSEDAPFDAPTDEVVDLSQLADVKRAGAHTPIVTLGAADSAAGRAVGTSTFPYRPRSSAMDAT